ncbi:MAG: inorganic phosphate transporter [Oscillatoriales cyanobacterium]|nr:MAG: inorganic phosphate transporter [Oscillatoriales cyanobacterium]
MLNISVGEIIPLLAIAALALYVAANLGANDVANSMGTSVGSKALTLKQAIIVAGILEFTGAVLFGKGVSETLATGVVNAEVFAKEPQVFLIGMVSVLAACGLWLQIATRMGLPVSSSHAVVGAIAGFSWVAAGLGAVDWQTIGTISLTWLATPFASGALAAIFYSLVKYSMLDRPDPLERMREWIPWLSTAMLSIFGIIVLPSVVDVAFVQTGILAQIHHRFGWNLPVQDVTIGLGAIATMVLTQNSWQKLASAGTNVEGNQEGTPPYPPLGGNQEGTPVGGKQEGTPVGGKQEGTPPYPPLGGKQEGTPVGEEGTPLGGNQEGTPPYPPLGGNQEGTPLGGNQEGSPVGGNQEGSPVGGKQEGTPLGGKQEGTPVGGKQEGTPPYPPLGGKQEGTPVGAVGGKQEGTPVGGKQEGTPVGGKQEGTPPYPPLGGKQEGTPLSLSPIEQQMARFQALSACFVAFAHGSNDVGNAVAPLAAIVYIRRTGSFPLNDFSVPLWILVLGGVGIVIGLALWGENVIATVGEGIIQLQPSGGFCAELATAATVLLASRLGLPVSTSHALVGAVVGVGLVNSWKSVRWQTLRSIGSAWLVTIPIAAGLAAAIFSIARSINRF